MVFVAIVTATRKHPSTHIKMNLNKYRSGIMFCIHRLNIERSWTKRVLISDYKNSERLKNLFLFEYFAGESYK